MDITDEASVEKMLLDVKPGVVIHCAAWTAVDAAEEEENKEKVRLVNGVGTENIAKICHKINAKMIYISTDYVFDREGTHNWELEDKRQPLNVYGATKYEGELAVEKWLD